MTELIGVACEELEDQIYPLVGSQYFQLDILSNYLLLWTKCFFCKNPKEENEAIRFFVFKLFDKVVNLTKNEGSKGQHDDQKVFVNYSLNYEILIQQKVIVIYYKQEHQTLLVKKDTQEHIKLSFSNEKVVKVVLKFFIP